MSDGEKNNLFERYKQQKIEQFVNNHPDVKNAKIIDESVVDQNQIEPKAKTEDSISEKLLTEITVQ
ncbi:hypothetical protein KA405_03525 [Patescibacteria group bacterium]|nr:hypothetical protein [Patescibacteria group bacterium]